MEYLSICIISMFVISAANARVYQLDIMRDDMNVFDRKTMKNDLKRSKRQLNPTLTDSMFNNLTVIAKEKIVKNSFTFPKDSNNVAFVYWKNSKANVVFILTCQEANTSSYNKLSSKGCNSRSSFYQSTNHGRTYEKKNLNNAFIHCIYLSPLNKSFKILTDYRNQTMYITNNEGINFAKHQVQFSPTFIRFHPYLENYVIAYDNTKYGKRSLYVSENGGVAWKLVSHYVLNYFWSAKDIDKDATLIYFEKQSNEQIDKASKHVFGTRLYVARSPYNSNEIQRVLHNLLMPYSVYLGNEYIIVQFVEDKKLYASHSRAKFYEMIYKDNSKLHLHHVVLSADHHEVLLGVIHEDNTMTLYLSDSKARTLYLVQNDIFTKPMKHDGLTPHIDFYEVKGIKYTYLVNKKREGTLISHDKGITWKKLNIKAESDNQPHHCAPNCSLILFIKLNELYSEFTAPVLSKESAPGVILAQGYLGKINDLMSRIQSDHYVYISTDGGYTWSKTLDSLYGYAMLDHGGLIAATPLKFTVNHHVTFTKDYGESWFQLHMTNHYSRIAAIISESSSQHLIINVFGFLQDQDVGSKSASNTWIVWQFNFENLFQGVCTEDDYMVWQHNLNTCVLGEQTKSKRRKVERSCINGDQFIKNETTTPCACTYNDFACDGGYFKQKSIIHNQFTCIALFSNHSAVAERCKYYDKYSKTRGYIKFYGNKCKGGVENDIGPVEIYCTITPPVLTGIQASTYDAYTHDVIFFDIQQTDGYYKTTYTWSFGDGSLGITGLYKDVHNAEYSFENAGRYNITVEAKNSNGRSSKSISIQVFDKFFEDAFIKSELPVVENIASEFSLNKFLSDGMMEPIRMVNDQVKYSWFFDNKPAFETSLSIKHKFKTSGHHQAEVVITKHSSCRSITKDVHVFKRCVKLHLYFHINNEHTFTRDSHARIPADWFNSFQDDLKKFLMYRFDIVNVLRLILNNKYGKAFYVYICDDDTDSITAQSLSQRIIEDIKNNKPVFKVNTVQDVLIVDAEREPFNELLNQSKHSTKEAWVYYLILIMAVVLIALALVVCYKKKDKLLLKGHPSRTDSIDNLVINMEETGDLGDNENENK